jgi:hydroxyethylthiazole kinase-like sugar kinase family protein
MIAELLSHWQPTVIKGNAAEIGAMAESTEVCILPSRTTRR